MSVSCVLCLCSVSESRGQIWPYLCHLSRQICLIKQNFKAKTSISTLSYFTRSNIKDKNTAHNRLLLTAVGYIRVRSPTGGHRQMPLSGFCQHSCYGQLYSWTSCGRVVVTRTLCSSFLLECPCVAQIFKITKTCHVQSPTNPRSKISHVQTHKLY